MEEERIRSAAYLIWEQEGRPDGHAEAHWIKATELVKAEKNEEFELGEVYEKPRQTPKKTKVGNGTPSDRS